MLSIQLQNEIFEKDWLLIPRGITIVAGANNDGKSTLLRDIENGINTAKDRGFRFNLKDYTIVDTAPATKLNDPTISGFDEWSFLDDRYKRHTIRGSTRGPEKYGLVYPGGGNPSKLNFTLATELFALRGLSSKYFQVSTPIPSENQYRKLNWNDLNSNCSEIVTALNNLETVELNQLSQLLRMVFPDIAVVKLKPSVDRSGHSEVYISDRGIDKKLSTAGAGIAQAVVLLYTCIFAPANAVIVFDEAFEHLHPKATKDLLRIIADYSKAYAIILATHDPAAIRSPFIKQLLHLQRTEGPTKITQVKGDDSLNVVRYLGLENIDLAFVEKVLLGEGITEELIFKYLMKQKILPHGLGIGSLSGLGITDAQRRIRKHAFKLTAEILQAAYKQELPIIFIRDRDSAEDSDLNQAISDASSAKLPLNIITLNRREIENYFLAKELVRDFIITEANRFSVALATQEIDEAYENLLASPESYPESRGVPEEDRETQCKGSQILQKLSAQLIPGFSYNKGDHGWQLFSRGLNLSIPSVLALRQEIVSAVN